MEESFCNTSVDIFHKTIRNILHNFIPHETLLVDEKDSPWLTNEIKNLINKKNTVFKHYRQNSDHLQILNKLESLQNTLIISISGSKRNYYSKMANKLQNT